MTPHEELITTVAVAVLTGLTVWTRSEARLAGMARRLARVEADLARLLEAHDAAAGDTERPVRPVPD